LTPDLAKIENDKVWSVINADCRTAMEDGKRMVRMRPKGGNLGGSNVGLALAEGVDFAEGTIEIDLKGNGKYDRRFMGVAFNVVDGKTFEAVYFRPFNFMADDPFRERAVQYVCWPQHTWEKLRGGSPGVYESSVKPVPDPGGWFHARIEVAKNKVRVWVNDAREPCLVVDRLTNREKGKIGLWVDSNEGTFSDLTVLPGKLSPSPGALSSLGGSLSRWMSRAASIYGLPSVLLLLLALIALAGITILSLRRRARHQPGAPADA
jgi:hypothetical protein